MAIAPDFCRLRKLLGVGDQADAGRQTLVAQRHGASTSGWSTILRAVPAIDWAVVRAATIAGLVVVIPSVIILAVVLGDDSNAAWAYLFGFVTLFGFAAAGYGAGRVRSDTPMMHGAIAALACYSIVQAFGTIKRIAAGEDVNPIQYPFLALLAAVMGVSGALFADWYRRKGLRV